MSTIKERLIEHEKKEGIFRIGLVGAGQMGTGLISQIEKMHGLAVVAVADILPTRAMDAYKDASVDTDVRETIYQFLKEINQNITIVLVTHDIGVLSSYVNRVSCLNRYLFTHDDDRYISSEMIEKAYSCPVELIAHGVPHRVLVKHNHVKEKNKEEHT